MTYGLFVLLFVVLGGIWITQLIVLTPIKALALLDQPIDGIFVGIMIVLVWCFGDEP